MTPTALNYLRVLIPAAGAVLLVLSVRTGRRPRGRPNRLVRALLIGLAAAALALWAGDAMFGFRTYINQWDMYHYYMGARYFPELGYEQLYECAVLADAENGFASEMPHRKFRDLASNALIPAQASLARPERCKDAFSAARWQEFRDDVGYFRSQATLLQTKTGRWNWPTMHADHGFNASPTWCLIGIPLANLTRATDDDLIGLSFVDLLLLAAMWGMVWWAFGWRGAAAAAIFWGSNLPARFGWTTASLLRHDWLVWTVTGVCLMRRRWPALAGAAITYAALLRLFPGLIVIGLVFHELLRAVRTRDWKPSSSTRRFAFGATICLVLLVPLSTLVCSRGWTVWAEFAANSGRYMAIPLSNSIGLKSLLAYEDETSLSSIEARVRAQPAGFALSNWEIAGRVEQEWIDARRRILAERGIYLALATLAFAAMLGWRATGQPAWAMLVLAAGLIPFAGNLTGYYYAFLLLYGLLASSRPWVGAVLCAFAAVTRVLGLVLPPDEGLYRWFSVLVLLAVVVMTWLTRVNRQARNGGEATRPLRASERGRIGPGNATLFTGRSDRGGRVAFHEMPNRKAQRSRRESTGAAIERRVESPHRRLRRRAPAGAPQQTPARRGHT